MFEEISQKLPRNDDRELLKDFIDIFEKDGSEAVKKKIKSIIDELRSV